MNNALYYRRLLEDIRGVYRMKHQEELETFYSDVIIPALTKAAINGASCTVVSLGNHDDYMLWEHSVTEFLKARGFNARISTRNTVDISF